MARPKWSPEAKNGHAGCQKGRLDGRTESDPLASEKNNTMSSHGAFLHFKLILLVLRVVQRRQKQSPEAETRRPGLQAAIRVV